MSDYARQFVDYLKALKDDNRAALAVLRRSLSFQPGAFPPAYPYVERFAAKQRHAQDAGRRALYVVAGLYALHPQQGTRSLAASLGDALRLRESPSIEKRFVALLGADAENLHEYLRQVVSLLAAEDLPINYAALLGDLSCLLNPRIDPEARDKIRQRWARDFYAALESSDVDANADTNAEPTT